jgi:hypothetical protein
MKSGEFLRTLWCFSFTRPVSAYQTLPISGKAPS